MSRTWIERAVWLALAMTTAVVGYVAGSSQQIRATIKLMQVEASGNLTQRIEVLSLLRINDVSGAVNRLESEMDTLVTSIAVNPGADRIALAYAKTYLSVAPPSAARAKTLSPALEGVAVLDPGKCKTALRALLLSVGRRSTDQGK